MEVVFEERGIELPVLVRQNLTYLDRHDMLRT
jgi:hypothetical protein